MKFNSCTASSDNDFFLIIVNKWKDIKTSDCSKKCLEINLIVTAFIAAIWSRLILQSTRFHARQWNCDMGVTI